MRSINRMNKSGSVKIVQEILEDGSNVFDVRVTESGKSYSQEVSIPCINIEAAEELFELLTDEEKYLI